MDGWIALYVERSTSSFLDLIVRLTDIVATAASEHSRGRRSRGVFSFPALEAILPIRGHFRVREPLTLLIPVTPHPAELGMNTA